jgi:hypothetical protein
MANKPPQASVGHRQSSAPPLVPDHDDSDSDDGGIDQPCCICGAECGDEGDFTYELHKDGVDLVILVCHRCYEDGTNDDKWKFVDDDDTYNEYEFVMYEGEKWKIVRMLD